MVGGGFVAVADTVSVSGTAVGMTVGGGLVGAAGVGDAVVGISDDMDAQAAIKTPARTSTII